MTDNEITKERIANANENLAVLRVVYGVSFGLGFWQLGQGLPWPWNSFWVVPPLLVAAMLTLLSIRFYWAMGNIRRYIKNKKHEDIHPIGRIIMMFHVPILMLHSFTFFILCRLYGDMYDDNQDFNEGVAYTFTLTYVALLYLNSVWVYWCHTPRTGFDFVFDIFRSKAAYWSYNNFSCASIVMALVLFLNIDPEGLYFLVFFLFGVNSGYDFYQTGHIYIFDEYG